MVAPRFPRVRVTRFVPQGDLVFFPYDVTVVLGAYLVGYAVFVSVVAPRLVLTVRARARLAGAVGAPTGAAHQGGLPKLAALAKLAAVGVYPVHTSETLLAFVQFGLLALFLYYVGAGQVGQRHSRIAPPVAASRVAPTFGVATTVTANLVAVWAAHRGGLYVRPAAAALYGATHQALHLLHRGVPPGVLPRLLGVVRASKGVAV